MRTMRFYMGALSVILIAFCANWAMAASDLEIAEYKPLTTGDYFDYEFDITQLIEAMEEEMEMDGATFKDVTSKFKQTVGGTEIVTAGGKSVDAYIYQSEVIFKFTLVADDGTEVSIDSSVTGKQWISKTTFRPVKSEETVFAVMVSSSESFSFTIESESTTRETYTKIDEIDPFPLKTGKTWTTSETYVSNTTDKSRMKLGEDSFGDWELSYEEDTVNQQTNYEIVSQSEVVTPAGTFEALKIKSQVTGEPNVTYEFRDGNGMMVQEEIGGDDGLAGIIKLKSYQFANAKEEEGEESEGVPLGTMIPVLAMGAATILAILHRRRGS